MPSYVENLKSAMNLLGGYSNTLFIGQGVGGNSKGNYGGTLMSASLFDVPLEKRIELPVIESLQMGISVGVGTYTDSDNNGQVCISIYPRFNFLLLCFSEIVNLLDTMPELADVYPRVIVRVAVGDRNNLKMDYGPQHSGDFSESLKLMVSTIDVITLKDKNQILPAYEHAYKKANKGKGASIMVEYAALYNT